MKHASGWPLLPWRLMRWWLQLPPFKGRDRVFYELVNWLTDPGHQIVVRTNAGFHMKLDLADEIDAEVYLLGEFDPTTSTWARGLIMPGDCVIDAGANIGYLSILYASAVAESGIVVAFEPSPATYRRLVTNARLNPAYRIMAINCGLGARVGQATLVQAHRERSGDAMLRPPVLEPRPEEPAPRFATYVIDVDTVDGFCARHHLAPALIKVDVEGSELAVLRGAEQTLGAALPVLILEFNASTARCFDYTPVDMAHWLSARFGYRFFSITENGLQPFTVLDDLNINMNLIGAIPMVHNERIHRANCAFASANPKGRSREIWAVARVQRQSQN